MRFFRIRSLRSELLRLSQEAEKIRFPPVVFGQFEYSEKVVGNHVCHFRRPAAGGGAWQLLVDPAKEQQESGSNVIGVGAMAVSSDGNKLAFLKDETGNESWRVVARNLLTGERIVLPAWLDKRVAKGIEWDASGKLLFVSLTEEHEVMRPSICVVVDTETGKTENVAEEPDPQVMLELSATKDKKYIRIGRLSYESSEQVVYFVLFFFFFF
jgi:protease II